MTFRLTKCVSPKVTLSITAEKRRVQVIWYNLKWAYGDRIIVTNQPPHKINQNPKILAEINPKTADGWVNTKIKFNYRKSRKVNVTTDCYGYWVNYITAEGHVMANGCLRAYALWMNNLRPGIESFRMPDLFIPGTHDAGAYKVDFRPGRMETPVTKYSLTQDEDIRGQLMHGSRYLDIRPAYNKYLPGERFYVHHGITRQRPMSEVVGEVRNFVLDTGEFVIFGMKEFPFGFNDDSIHKKFVNYLERKFAGLIINPALTWNVTLGELWERKQYIFLAYDNDSIVKKFSTILFPSVKQRWGDVRSWKALQAYLRSIYKKEKDLTRPVSDMAELTANVVGVALDKYGGLRRMADSVNSRVSNLYRNELGTMANIVAVDYLRGTTIAELAVEINGTRINAILEKPLV